MCSEVSLILWSVWYTQNSSFCCRNFALYRFHVTAEWKEVFLEGWKLIPDIMPCRFYHFNGSEHFSKMSFISLAPPVRLWRHATGKHAILYEGKKWIYIYRYKAVFLIKYNDIYHSFLPKLLLIFFWIRRYWWEMWIKFEVVRWLIKCKSHTQDT